MTRIWRQGHVLTESATREIDPSADADTRFIVCSHSCDIVRMEGPRLLLARGKAGREHNGTLINAQSIRCLQLTTASGSIVHYEIDSLAFYDAALLDRHEPWSEEGHTDDDVRSLRLWLSQRFDRLELPDEVVAAMSAAGLQAKLIDATKNRSKAIRDIRIFYNDNFTPPHITFLVIYDSGNANGEAQAKHIAAALDHRAEQKADKLDGRLIYNNALAIADTAITFAQVLQTHRFRVEYLSLREDPPSEAPRS